MLLLLLLLLLLFYRKTTEGPNNKLEKSLEDFYIACDQLQLYLVKMLFFLIVKKPDQHSTNKKLPGNRLPPKTFPKDCIFSNNSLIMICMC